VKSAAPLLALNGLVYPARGAALFDGLDLKVHAGERVVILGDSGAGKSTLLDLIADAPRRAYRGDLQVDRAHTAVLTQDGALIDYLDVLGNLQLVRRHHRAARATDPARLLEQLNIPAALHRRPVHALSGGERRRVAIARALLRQPNLLLFDEPDTGLDINNITELAAAIVETVQAPGRGAIVTTHDPYFAASVASRVYLLRDGRLTLLHDWSHAPADPRQTDLVETRRLELETRLRALAGMAGKRPEMHARHHGPLAVTLAGSLGRYLAGFVSLRSPRDYLANVLRTFHLSFLSGALFYLLVGAMLGATTIAVIESLRTRALGGFVARLVTPEFLLGVLSGGYILFLAPAIGAVLFVARSGSIITGWLGTLELGRQIRALKLLGINPDGYLRGPVAMGLIAGFLATLAVFGAGMWFGSWYISSQVHGIANAAELLVFPPGMVEQSRLSWKLALYSFYISFVATGIGMAPKDSSERVARHITKSITYSTVLISITELVIALRFYPMPV
jgi:ABC-type nitrate/sulfonate/bicarbonate transport system ATPase subunit/ABC-type transporter Mla maintaining outer membrane lipid asymmetry permease subunit MlaE